MARPTMPGGVTAGDYILESWGDNTNSVLGWIANDKAAWTPTVYIGAGALDTTNTWCYSVKIGSLFVAIARIEIDKAASPSNTLYVTVPYTLTSAYAVGGTASYYLSGTTEYVLKVKPYSTAQVSFQRDSVGTPFATTTTVNDYLELNMVGFWE